MTKKDREEREYTSLFCDQRYAKRAWAQIMHDALNADANTLPYIIDPKTNEPTRDSEIEHMAYDEVKARLVAQGLERNPTQAELIVQCNIIRARFADTPFTTILDRTAGKVKEEISIEQNPYEELTDDELEALMAYREQKKAGESDKGGEEA